MSEIPNKKQKIIMSYTILFHGNCIDGWFSAYIAYKAIQSSLQGSFQGSLQGVFHDNIKMYPISPSKPNTWPTQMAGNHILLLDISVSKEYRDRWISEGALSVECIDHHATSISHWPANNCPIHTESCAALQTWMHFYPTKEIPLWLYSIDRIDRWDNPTQHDRFIREYLSIIAHKPIRGNFDEAFRLTDEFIINVETPEGLTKILVDGENLLQKKDGELLKILDNGTIHTFKQDYIHHWNLPFTWLGTEVFIIDNTGLTLDSTEASYLVFSTKPLVSVFINYRSRYDKYSRKLVYTYSARSRGFDITQGTLLKGHPNSAGATLSIGDVPILPFLLTDPWEEMKRIEMEMEMRKWKNWNQNKNMEMVK